MKIILALILLFQASLSMAAAADSQTSAAEQSVEQAAKPISGFSEKRSTSAPIKKVEDQSFLPQLLQVTFGLFVVLFLIVGVAWFARRFGQFNVANKGGLRIVGGLHMGAREKLVLVQVGDKQILLGVAPGRISNLHTLDEPLVVESASPGTSASFAERLAQVMRGNNK